MTSEAVGELEDKSVEEVLKLMKKRYPKLSEIEGLKEHLEG